MRSHEKNVKSKNINNIKKMFFKYNLFPLDIRNSSHGQRKTIFNNHTREII